MHEQIYITPSHRWSRSPSRTTRVSPARRTTCSLPPLPTSPAPAQAAAPSRAAAQPGRTPLSPSLSPGRAPQAPDGPCQQEDRQPAPGQRQGGLDPPPPEEPPFFQQGTAPILEDPAHSPAPRPGWPAASALGLSDTGRPPAAVRDSTPRAAPRPEAVKKLSQLTVSIPVTSRAPAPPPGGASFHIGRPWGTDGSPGRFPCTPPPQPVPPTR